MTLKLFIRCCLVLITLLGVSASFSWGDHFTYVTFTDRDLLRGSTFFSDFILLGSELGNRVARTPGGMMPFVTACIQFFMPSAFGIYMLGIIFNILSGLGAAFLLRRVLGITGAIAFAALLLSTISNLELSWKFWNPTPTLGFAVLSGAIILRYLAGTIALRYLIVSGILLSVAAQFHVSFLGAFGFILIATLISAPRRGLQSITLLIGGFLLPYLPYIVFDAFNGFEWISAFLAPKAILARPSSGLNLTALVIIMLKLTGGQLYLAQTVPNAGLPNSLTAGLLNLFNAPLLLVCGFVIAAVGGLLGKPGKEVAVNRAIIIYLMFFLFLAPAVLLSYASNASSRYYIIFIFPYCAILSIGFAMLVDRAEKMISARILIVVIAGLILAKITALNAYYYTRPAETMSAYAFKRDIVDAMSKDWGMAADQISDRVGVYIVGNSTRSDNAGWLAAGENFGLDYIAKVRAKKVREPDIDTCVVIVANERLSHAPINVPERIFEELPKGFSAKETRRIDHGSFVAIGYLSDPSSNCFKTFQYRYIPSAQEKRIEDALKNVTGVPANGIILRKNGPVREYIMPLPKTNEPGMMVESAILEDGVHLTLHSENMRGYATAARYRGVEVKNAAIILEGINGVSRRAVIEGTIGADGLYTPIRFVLSNVPPGEYILRLSADSFDALNKDQSVQAKESSKFDILLDEKFLVPQKQ